LPIEK